MTATAYTVRLVDPHVTELPLSITVVAEDDEMARGLALNMVPDRAKVLNAKADARPSEWGYRLSENADDYTVLAVSRRVRLPRAAFR